MHENMVNSIPLPMNGLLGMLSTNHAWFMTDYSLEQLNQLGLREPRFILHVAKV
jgi:hypothetical protein